MRACAADLKMCVAPCAVMQCILEQGADNKGDHSEDDYDEDNRGRRFQQQVYWDRAIIEYILREASKNTE